MSSGVSGGLTEYKGVELAAFCHYLLQYGTLRGLEA